MEVCKKYKNQDRKETGPVLAPIESNIGEPSRNAVKRDYLGSETESEEESVGKSNGGSTTASEEEMEIVEKKTVPKLGTKSVNLLGGLNRAQMERERLERAKKAGVRQENLEPPATRMKLENTDNKPSWSSTSSTASTVKSALGLTYPNGTIKWTYARGYPVESHHITIEQVLQKETLKAAVLSGFQVSTHRDVR